MSVTTARRPPAAGRRRRQLWIGLALVLVLIGGAVGWRLTAGSGRGLAAEAVVTASSTALGFSARDAVEAGSVDEPGPGWRSNGQTAGAWIELNWSQAHLLRQVAIVRNPLTEPGVTDGFLSFGDGSYLQVRLSSTSRVTVVPISPRSADRLRFTASVVSAGAVSVSVAEILADTAPAGDDVVTGDVADGNVAVDATVTRSRPAGAWVQLGWSRPRELSSVEIVGGPGPAYVSSATLTFGDGSTLPVGAVLPDPARPTIVAFMPRVTTTLRLTVDRAGGTGPAVPAELRVYERGSTPARSPEQAPQAAAPADGSPCAAPAPPAAGLVVRCPQTGSVVDGTVNFQVGTAAGYSSVTATVWPGDGAAPAGTPVSATPDASGTATLAVDVSGAPAGPLTVAFEATGGGEPTSTVYFQLYRRPTGPAERVPSSSPATGRTLAYAEEFDRPVSLSRTGAGADYAAGKPTYQGAEDFGDAPFSAGNVTNLDGRYLGIDVTPGPGAGEHRGGLLASARQGGSGFSAQYGYFEARMLAPAARGTWPAFWMLPSDNLVAPQPAVAEVDAVEMYGHEPQGACQSTHDYQGGKDGGVAACGPRFPTARDALSWHTYGVSITPSDITFYLDGTVVATAPQVAGGRAPMFFLLDLALGGGWPVDLQGVQDRARLYVDYVRVYV